MNLQRHTFWKRAAAQAAIFALIFQTVVSVFGCGGALAHGVGDAFSQSHFSQNRGVSQKSGFRDGKAAQSPAICSANGFRRMAANGGGSPTGGPDETPQHECPACLTHCCQTGAVTAIEAVLLPAPPVTSTAIAPEARRLPLGAALHAFRNRGPPSSLAF